MNHTMLSIGRFSQLTGLTTRALRLYDELGLLRPAAVDAGSGYRQYATEQITSAALISRLRGVEMPLEEVGHFLDSDPGARERTLAAHRARLVDKVRAMNWAVQAVDNLAAELAPSSAQKQQPRVTAMVIQTLRDQPVMRIRLTLREEDLWTSSVGPGFGQPGQDQPRDWRSCMIWRHMRLGEIDPVAANQELVQAGPPYLSCSEPDEAGAVQAEIGLQLDRIGTGEGRVEPGVLPGGDVATLSSTGYHAKIGVAYRKLWADMERAGLTPAGEPRELLMTNPAWDPDPDHGWVQLIWPVR